MTNGDQIYARNHKRYGIMCLGINIITGIMALVNLIPPVVGVCIGGVATTQLVAIFVIASFVTDVPPPKSCAIKTVLSCYFAVGTSALLVMLHWSTPEVQVIPPSAITSAIITVLMCGCVTAKLAADELRKLENLEPENT